MSDDWQVVEEALNLRMVIAGRPEGDVKMAEAQIALDRLREREAQLERHSQAASQDAVFFRKRMVRLEEALREIVRMHDNATEHFNDLGMADVARRALGEK